MSSRAFMFEPLGPLSADGRAHLGVEIQGSGQPALPVVMVWLPERITSDAALLADIQAQTESAMRLEHPNIIRVRGMEKLDPGWARIVEFADAESLRKLLDAGRDKVDLLWPAIAAAIVADACLGVHHAHETGEAKDPKRPLLHGGLRPDVLLVNYRGITKITGYGASMLAPVGKDLARDAYTAPEQVLGGREAMTRQTDVYQLGAVLYECLTGVPPFTAEEGLLENLILTKTPGSHRLDEHKELGEIALKALAKKASDRYPTALAMHQALVSVQTSPPVAHDVVARWANLLIPPNHPDRTQRRELIREALATTGATEIPEDLAAALEEAKPTAPIPIGPPLPIPPPAPVPWDPESAAAANAAPPKEPTPGPQPAVSPKPVAAAPRAFERPPELSIPPPSHTVRNVLLGLVLGAGAAAWIWYVRKTQGPSPVEQAVRMAAAADAGAPVAAATSLDAGPADAGVVSSAAADAGAIVAAADAGQALPEKFALEVQTDPPLQIKIDGDAAGTGSARAVLAAGKHRVEASSRALHIFTAREVDLKKDHQLEKITVGKAQLAFDVPAGAKVTVDGKAVGTAPVQPVELYAGTHEAIVEYNGAQTVQRVPITADFNVTLTVHAN